MLEFERDNHAAAGIGSDGNLYKNTSYSFIENLDYSFIGVPVNRLRGSNKSYSDPIVIPIGNGTKIYRSGNQTKYIADTATFADARSTDLALRMKAIRQDSVQNISEYNRLTEKFYDWSRIHTYIIHHRFDRKGVFEYLKSALPA
ncbi:MAG: hypothetical protein A4E35_02211 [Methanoregula sp. PtaU1.Bin051]|nr:MAG: hypothetical protein A4E35_02211 [Methanoregula sp. PtaU1.Bin051]